MEKSSGSDIVETGNDSLSNPYHTKISGMSCYTFVLDKVRSAVITEYTCPKAALIRWILTDLGKVGKPDTGDLSTDPALDYGFFLTPEIINNDESGTGTDTPERLKECIKVRLKIG